MFAAWPPGIFLLEVEADVEGLVLLLQPCNQEHLQEHHQGWNEDLLVSPDASVRSSEKNTS